MKLISASTVLGVYLLFEAGLADDGRNARAKTIDTVVCTKQTGNEGATFALTKRKEGAETRNGNKGNSKFLPSSAWHRLLQAKILPSLAR